ncbi:unnamed protein product [Callosobruchus maculatus]|uniref:Uncharacterized protein n=1 Tax=Callosobruchus maculatus TaxID=64391 RepID=A0A653CIE2_CALMS|nr:unnamed protein product [Callosobruchus maculatus]
MWGDPEPDPGGQPSTSISRELTDLKSQNEQQQVLIAQLKEMLRKEQSNVPQEKVEEYIQTLSKVTAKKSQSRKDELGTDKTISVDSNKKINLLKQQLEENKAKLAERGKSQKGIAELVSQLQAQLMEPPQQTSTIPISVLDKPVGYSKNTSQEELYNILLKREGRISELVNKTQKQEATIMDLQENLKEKDQVIEARTKAITLMTDSLSKKGKDTLDALDDTKEQMRNMQEDFVKLEEKMKLRQKALLNDLKSKNLEITELQEHMQQFENENKSLSETMNDLRKSLDTALSDCKGYAEKNAELEKSLQEVTEELNRLKNTGSYTVTASEKADKEIAKLKKQLEESNKNMIKIKAQSKSKIKELTKNIETFKKVSDTNALIVQLQAENRKLSEKIAELEEEKGNLQLKMVESTSSMKDSECPDCKCIQEKLDSQNDELSEKDKVILLLENDILSLKEQLTSLTHLKSSQVTSEMKSVQIEEQLDLLESENVKLKENIEILNREKEELNQRIEELVSEKQDINSKLESYIQEAEAEATPTLEMQESTEGLETTQDLNESVIQLSEESTELLERIELFNSERKEVMGKMEQLKEENNILSMKISEVENNRDILAETYEQLQNEKEKLQQDNEKLKKQVEILESASGNQENATCFDKLQSDCQRLLDENESLRHTLKELDTKIQEKDKLELIISESSSKISEMDTQLKEKISDIEHYQTIISENKNELINFSNITNDLRKQLTERENEIKDLNAIVNELNQVVSRLQSENENLGNFETMEAQIDELKNALTEQMRQAEHYAAEALRNNEVIIRLKEELKQMNDRILDAEHDIEVKAIEIDKLSCDLENKDKMIANLQQQVKEKDEKVNLVSEQMKEKYLTLQRQLDGNQGSLQKTIEDLSSKNKEQMEKMKKIAANLKKKNQAYQELEEKFMEVKEKWETEANNKETNESVLLSDIEELKKELEVKQVLLDDYQRKIKHLNEQVQSLEQHNVDLQNSLLEARSKHERISEITLKQELSTSLHEEFDPMQTGADTNKDKIKELELIIETNESDIADCKQRIEHLEEHNNRLQREREHLESRICELESSLRESDREMKEKMNLEEALSHKLEDLAVSEGDLTKKLDTLSAENESLCKKNKDQEEVINKLRIKIKKAQEKLQQLKSIQTANEEMERSNEELKKQIFSLENQLKHAHEDCEFVKKQNKADYENIENDYQSQLEELMQVKNVLSVECEKLKEFLKAAQEREQELMMEAEEYRRRLQEDGVNINSQINQLTQSLQQTTANWRAAAEEVSTLKQQLQQLQQELVIEKAKQTVQEVITSAVDKVVSINTVGTQTKQQQDVLSQAFTQENQAMPSFTWPDQQFAQVSIPCEGIPETPASPLDELKHKINELEYLLNVIQQEVAQHCSEMLKGLVNTIRTKVHIDSAVKQVGLSELESQVLTAEDIKTSGNREELQRIEFQMTGPCLGEQCQPVVEEVAQPKKAYLTYYPGVQTSGENDDGWGWGPEEGKLEEEYIQNSENAGLKEEISNLQLKLQTIQAERDNYLEEIKLLQAKSGKLVKKCKELKQKNDELLKKGKSDGDNFFDLNETIQEELKTQVTQLEKKIKELQAELDKEKHERANILKRVDVLTAANEKMVEMKEIQESEVFHWKRKYDDVEKKLREQEWSSDGFTEGHKVESKIEGTEELQKTIQELMLDNEELQSLLNEQRQLRIEAEKNKAMTSNVDVTELTEQKIQLEQLVSEKDAALSELKQAFDKSNALNEQFQAEIKELQGKLEKLKDEYIELQSSNNQCIVEMEQQNRKFKDLEIVNAQLQNEIASSSNVSEVAMEYAQELEKINARLWQVEQEKNSLERELESYRQSSNDIVALNSKLLELENTKTTLEKEIDNAKDALNREIEGYKQSYSEQIETLSSKLFQLENDKSRLEGELDRFRQSGNEVEKLNSKLLEMETEKGELQKELESCRLKNAEIEQLLAEVNLKYDGSDKRITMLERELEEERLRLAEMKFDYETKFVSPVPVTQQDTADLSNALEESRYQVMALEKEVDQLKAVLEQSQKEVEELRKGMDEQLARAVEDLEKKWQEQVDERGNAVAESWKYHLSIVEAEFAGVQNKLKSEIDELEAKCNALVNENNELRKNVDAEIRNEVDRVSALQQQISDRQLKIKELQEEIERLRHLETDIEVVKRQLSEKDCEIANLKTVVATTQQQFEEQREIVEEIVKVLETNTPWPLACEKQVIKEELQRQLLTTHDKDQQIIQLNEQITRLQSELDTSQKDSAEIINLHSTIAALQAQLESNKQEKELQIHQLNEQISQMQAQLVTLQNGNAEIFTLQSTITALQAQLESSKRELVGVQNEKLTASQMVQDYEAKLMDYKMQNDLLEKALDEKNLEIESFANRFKEAETLKNDNNREVEDLTNIISQLKQDAAVLQQSLSDCQQQLFDLTQTHSNNVNELETVNAQLNYSQQNVQILENEVTSLREQLENTEKEYAASLEASRQNYLKDLETYYEEILANKDQEIQSLQSQFAAYTSNIQDMQKKLETVEKEKKDLILSIDELETGFAQQTTALEEKDSHMREMNKIIEDQVMRIEDMKNELYQKSSDYDSLIAGIEVDNKPVVEQPRNTEADMPDPTSHHGAQSSATAPAPEEDLSEPVSRAELDLALYMLHQRDVRCEELTVELTQLLEERDTLQLRLSNAIREKEELRQKATGESSSMTEAIPSTSSQKSEMSKSSAIFLAASGTELASDPLDESDRQTLATKLSELKSVGYKKDKTFVDEQAARRMQQLSIMQQHFQEAAKLPPEAAAKLVDASYTLSRDVQSPSKVLLNWLWGRSTPKVNDT